MPPDTCSLDIPHQQLSALITEVAGLADGYWHSLAERRAFPVTSGTTTKALFSRGWREEGIGREVLDTFSTIADHARPSGGAFFGYIFGSGEPVGAVSELLIAALNQNATSWRSSPAGTAIEQTVV